jgi:hypothetical protein
MRRGKKLLYTFIAVTSLFGAAVVGAVASNAALVPPMNDYVLFNGTQASAGDARCGSSGPFEVHGSFRAVDTSEGDDDALLKVEFADKKSITYPIPEGESFSFTHMAGTGLGDAKVIVSEAEGTIVGWLSASRYAGVAKVDCKILAPAAILPGINGGFSIADVQISEGDTGTKEVNAIVTRLGSLTNAVSVNYATQNGTATAGSDYVAENGTLNFAASDATETISIVVNGDTENEVNEVFGIFLSGQSAGTTLVKGIGIVTLLDEAGD